MQSMYLFAKYGVHTLHVVHTLHETESGECKLWMQSMEAAGSQQTSLWSALVRGHRGTTAGVELPRWQFYSGRKASCHRVSLLGTERKR